MATAEVRPGLRAEEALIYPDHQITVEGAGNEMGRHSRSTLLLGEDKIHRVMAKAAPLLNSVLQLKTYVYPTVFESAAAPVRILTQVGGQIVAARASGDPAAWINKLYASSSRDGLNHRYHCCVKLVDDETIHISKWYDDSDSLENTVAVILYSLEQLYPS
ncbi:hypothetical protein C8R44DRAFT_750498 [Mycena epipterygia]|nr:hypothetical protein C8R44DRAFT_750498 [Mycena epipterygia]